MGHMPERPGRSSTGVISAQGLRGLVRPTSAFSVLGIAWGDEAALAGKRESWAVKRIVKRTVVLEESYDQ